MVVLFARWCLRVSVRPSTNLLRRWCLPLSFQPCAALWHRCWSRLSPSRFHCPANTRYDQLRHARMKANGTCIDRSRPTFANCIRDVLTRMHAIA